MIMNQNSNEMNKISHIGMNLIRRQLKFTTRLIVYSKLNNINENYKEFQA